MLKSFLFSVLALFSLKAHAALENNLRNGDIVFIRSKSDQSKALEEVTQSIWTHMGIALKLDSTQKQIVDSTDDGTWMVVHSGGPVRFDTLNVFLASGTKHSVKRLKEGVDFEKAQKLFKAAKPFADKKTPYDIYFTVPERYCSGFVATVYKKALGIELGVESTIAELEMKGPEAQKILSQRFSSKARAQFTVEKWKTKTTITPVSIYNSALLIPLP